MNENNTQKLLNPVLLPKILGPKIFPSNCCKTKINNKNQIHFEGSTNKIINADGTAPINGPKYGIIFVAPTITDIINAYGILKINIPTKQIIPTIKESINLALKKSANILSVDLVFSKITLTVSSLNKAYNNFLH